ncbi:MAG: twin-arginine translocation signal domain-containing protein [Bacteroidota bacterium]
MKRRSFIQKTGMAGILAGTGLNMTASGSGGVKSGYRVPPHNWDNHDFGPPPSITDRLNQGPFSAYGPDATAPSKTAVPNVGMRIQLMSPVIEPHSVPDFVADKVPFVELGTTGEIGIPGKVHAAPRYDHPEFMAAYQELDNLLSDLYNGHDLVEFVDTCMYGFWGEGHTWPFEGNPFPDYHTAEKTSIALFEHQAGNWDRTPLLTNTQPDFSHVGNSEVLDRTIRSHNWLRTDTIFIENEQIEALSNRPPWAGALVENGISSGGPGTLRMSEGVSRSENIIRHAKDVSPNYFSLWNWHQISAARLNDSCAQFKEPIDELRVTIGYRVRPSWIWIYEQESCPTLIAGVVNDGVAGVPGALRIYVKNSRGRSGRQHWPCRQELNEDGSLILRRNI